MHIVEYQTDLSPSSLKRRAPWFCDQNRTVKCTEQMPLIMNIRSHTPIGFLESDGRRELSRIISTILMAVDLGITGP
jgi:hypothetical protein